MDKRQFEQVCSQLAKQLKADDLKATVLFEQHRELIRAGLSAAFDSFEAAVRSFDFETALDILEKRTVTAMLTLPK